MQGVNIERRRLVGRRFEDYLRNNIVIELTPEEILWRMILSDPRYNSLIERRKGARRKSERSQPNKFSILKPGSSFLFTKDFFKNLSGD